MKKNRQDFRYILQCFGITDIECIGIEELSAGHINRTFLVRTQTEAFVLQSLNQAVFAHPKAVMKNIATVTTAFQTAKTTETTGVSVPEYLHAGVKNYVTVGGEIWRMYQYIPSNASGEDMLFQTGYAFGAFIRILNAYHVQLEQSLEGYHDFSGYYDKLLFVQRKKDHGLIAHDPIDYELNERIRELRSALVCIFTDKLPRRCIHGDAKSDNIVFTNQMTQTIIDLDTVMYHYAALDYGDMIRSAVGDADGTKMLKMVQNITAGFAKGLAGLLAPEEIESLYYGILWVTGELAVRYQTDCYAEEKYFQTKTAEQCMERTEQLMRQLDRFTDAEAEIQKIISEAFR